MKKKLKDLKKALKQSDENPRFIELKEKWKLYKKGNCIMTVAEMNELGAFYNQNSEATIELTDWYNRMSIKLLTIACLLNLTTLLIYLMLFLQLLP